MARCGTDQPPGRITDGRRRFGAAGLAWRRSRRSDPEPDGRISGLPLEGVAGPGPRAPDVPRACPSRPRGRGGRRRRACRGPERGPPACRYRPRPGGSGPDLDRHPPRAWPAGPRPPPRSRCRRAGQDHDRGPDHRHAGARVRPRGVAAGREERAHRKTVARGTPELSLPPPSPILFLFPMLQSPSDPHKFLKKAPKRLAVVDQNACLGCAGSPSCVAFCEVTVKDAVVDAIRVVDTPATPSSSPTSSPTSARLRALRPGLPVDAITMYDAPPRPTPALRPHGQALHVEEYGPASQQPPRVKGLAGYFSSCSSRCPGSPPASPSTPGARGVCRSTLAVAALAGTLIPWLRAFLLSWGCEVAQLDIAQALALSFCLHVVVLPEYSVDMYFLVEGGQGPRPIRLPGRQHIRGKPAPDRRRLAGGAPRSLAEEQGHEHEAWRRPPPSSSSTCCSPRSTRFGCRSRARSRWSTRWSSSRSLMPSAPQAGRRTSSPELLGPAAAMAWLPPMARRAAVVACFSSPAFVIFIPPSPSPSPWWR